MKTLYIKCKNYSELFKSRWLKTKEIFDFFISLDSLIINDVVKVNYHYDKVPRSKLLFT
jgi:hypothetical protein